VRELIRGGRADTVHDVSDGGLLIAISEMAMAGGKGAELDLRQSAIPFLFGEDQSRYILAVSAAIADTVLADATKHGVKATAIGQCGGDSLNIPDVLAIPVAQLRAAHEGWFPAFMSGTH